jgi:multidrug transporter EmrE-like cation transporter
MSVKRLLESTLRELTPESHVSISAAAGGFLRIRDWRLVHEVFRGTDKAVAHRTFLLLFIAGALLQGRAMNTADLGMAYILVLGLEAGITVIFSAIVLGEHFSIARIVALTMVIAGSALLTQT